MNAVNENINFEWQKYVQGEKGEIAKAHEEYEKSDQKLKHSYTRLGRLNACGDDPKAQ